MCGIIGWVDWKRNLQDALPVLMKMNERLVPRGPDAEGYWVAEHVGFAHRRFIVADRLG